MEKSNLIFFKNMKNKVFATAARYNNQLRFSQAASSLMNIKKGDLLQLGLNKSLESDKNIYLVKNDGKYNDESFKVMEINNQLLVSCKMVIDTIFGENDSINIRFNIIEMDDGIFKLSPQDEGLFEVIKSKSLSTLPFFEKKSIKLIREALQRNGNNRKKTAEELGISVRTLYRKIKAYKF